MLFSRNVEEVMPPRGGAMQTLRLIHQLVRPDRKKAAPNAGVTDLRSILDRAAQTLKRRSIVFIVSDFISDDGWDEPLGRLAQRHEVMACWLNDPREEELPPIGPLVLEDAETGEQVYVDTRDKGFQERFQQLVFERRQRLERTFARNGVDVLRLTTDGDLVQSIARFAMLRRETRRRSGSGIALAGAGA
jgi:uncharacterized protein (DUF58 family)